MFGSFGGGESSVGGSNGGLFGAAKSAPMFGAGQGPMFGSKTSEPAPAVGAFAFGVKPSESKTDSVKTVMSQASDAPKNDSSSFKIGSATSSSGTSGTGTFGGFGVTKPAEDKPGNFINDHEESIHSHDFVTETKETTATSGFSFGVKPAVSDDKPVAAAAAFSFGSKPDITKSTESTAGIGFGSTATAATTNNKIEAKSDSAAEFSFGSTTASKAASPAVPASSMFSVGSWSPVKPTTTSSSAEVSSNPSNSGAPGFGSGGGSSSGAFSFGSSNKPTDTEKPTAVAVAASKAEEKPVESSSSVSPEYLSHIKALNLQVLAWLKSHVEKDPLVILSPVFKDYDKHLEDIDKQYKHKKESSSATTTPSAAKVTDNAELPNNDSSLKPSSTGSFSIGLQSSKPTGTASAFSFGSTPPTTTAAASAFSFGSSTAQSTTTATASSFSFGSAAPTTSSSSSAFSFNSSGATGFGSAGAGPAAGGFSFGAGGFGSSSSAPAAAEKKEEAEDEEDQPPVVEVKQVEETDALYSKKCKLFYKKEGNYVEKGVGMLYLKSVDGGKTQLLIRADTNLGNVLLNILLSPSIPTTRVGKNNVMLVCVPNPPVDPKDQSSEPCPMLIR